MRRVDVLVAVVGVLTGVAGCTAAAHRRVAETPTLHPVAVMTLTNATTPTATALKRVLVTAADVTRLVPPASRSLSGSSSPPSPSVPVGRVSTTTVSAADDARVRTLLTWCTHTSAAEDPAATVYGPRLTVRGPHGRNTVYSYARALPSGTRPEVAAYTARLARCWRHVLLPVMAATLDPHIQHLTVAATSRPISLPTPAYGSVEAVEGVIRWHPTPARTVRSAFDVAVAFGAHTQVTVLAAGADSLTTGARHLRTDLAAITARLRAAEHPPQGPPPVGTAAARRPQR